MRTGLALLVTLLMLSALMGAAAHAKAGAPWSRKQVVVASYISAPWQPRVQEAVDLINTRMPAGGPRLVYQAMPEMACDLVPKGHQITVCSAPFGKHRMLGLTTSHLTQHGVTWARIQLTPIDTIWAPPRFTEIACHKLFHAVVPDAPHGNWVDAEPCPFDKKAAREAYTRRG